MLFLSAQPDELYFIWQIKIQLFNFKKNGINGSSVHVIFGINETISDNLKQLVLDNDYAKIFVYEDIRESSVYSSSIRPHLIKQHLLNNPQLEHEVIFYHDSDVIFRELPKFDKLANNGIWYVSNTRSYISASFLKEQDDIAFEKMCSIVGISRTIVEDMEMNSGGAQYLLKNTTHDFWEKVEDDSEKLYIFLKKQNHNKIQSWCADMWALLWNAWLKEYIVEIHEELDFCWPHQPLLAWETTKIFHNSGVSLQDRHNIFCKGIFRYSSPFGLKDLNFDNKTCGFKYYEEVRDYSRNKDIIPNIDNSKMDKDYINDHLNSLVEKLIKTGKRNGFSIAQNDLLSISVLLYHYSESRSDEKYKTQAEEILELAASKQLPHNYSLNRGATAFGLALEHLVGNGFLTEDINYILKDIDEACCKYISDIEELNTENYIQVLSILYYTLNRSNNILDAFPIDRIISLFYEFYWVNYKGFLVTGGLESLDRDLATLNSLSLLLEIVKDNRLIVIIEKIMSSILHYVFIRQNEVKLFNAKIIIALINSNSVLKDEVVGKTINICLENYLIFLLKDRAKAKYPQHPYIFNGLGGVLSDHLELAKLLGPIEVLDLFIRELWLKISCSLIEHDKLENLVGRKSSSFINAECEFAIISMALKDEQLLLNFRKFYLV